MHIIVLLLMPSKEHRKGRNKANDFVPNPTTELVKMKSHGILLELHCLLQLSTSLCHRHLAIPQIDCQPRTQEGKLGLPHPPSKFDYPLNTDYLTSSL